MEEKDINNAMDDFYDIVKNADPLDAPVKLVRAAGHYDNLLSITALARLATILHARLKHARARLDGMNNSSGE